MNAKETKVKAAVEKLVTEYYDKVPYYGQGNEEKLKEAKECAKIAVRAIYDYEEQFGNPTHGVDEILNLYDYFIDNL